MSRYCVVVAEGSKARFFTLESADIPELESGPHLVEQKQMDNPDHQAHAGDLWSDVRSGRNRSPGGPGHAYVDHGAGYDAECERRFARDIARELDQITRSNGTRRVLLCAEKRMLGFLRPPLHNAIPNGVDLQEIPKDLAKLSPHQLQERLSREGHLPKRRAARQH